MAWMSPSLRLEYGPYFKPDPEEQSKIVAMCRVAIDGIGGAMVPLRNIVQKLAPIYGIENVDAALEQIKAEAQEAQKKQIELVGARHNMTPNEPPAGSQAAPANPGAQ